jgi:hypothetical protein
MDSVEFPDTRLILEGSCFSLEPGLYFGAGRAGGKFKGGISFGMRTEIDVYVLDGKPVVSGFPHQRQYALLSC